MNRMKEAHRIAREMATEYPDLNYRERFSMAMKSLNTTNEGLDTNANKETEPVVEEQAQEEAKVEEEGVQEMNKETVKAGSELVQEMIAQEKQRITVLPRKEVTLENDKRVVALKIKHDEKKALGIILNGQNVVRFVWKYEEFDLPSLEVECEDKDQKINLSKYARFYILERLKLDNVELPVKRKESNVDYITFPLEDGVACNVFVNGYIRGIMNGVIFSWEPGRYPQYAIALSEAGFEGFIHTKVDATPIRERVLKAGFKNTEEVFDYVRKATGFKMPAGGFNNVGPVNRIVIDTAREGYKTYAGIGSRECPEWASVFMGKVANHLANEGYILRSGGAEGSDKFFENACDAANGEKEIYLPWKGFNGSGSELIVNDQEAYKVAAKYHPVYNKLSQGAQKLQARNSHQVLGWDLKSPVDFIICYTEGGKGQGGTGQAIRIARANNIPVFDIGRYSSFEQARLMYAKFLRMLRRANILKENSRKAVEATAAAAETTTENVIATTSTTVASTTVTAPATTVVVQDQLAFNVV